MNSEVFEKGFKKKLDRNFLKLSKYYDFSLEVFFEFRTLIFEINNCLLLELNRAAITLTNHLLERLLNHPLINNKIGIRPIEFKKWDEEYEAFNTKKRTIDLVNSINNHKKFELISEKEKSFLLDTIRALILNGFLLANSSKILTDLSEDSKMFQRNFYNPNKKLKAVSVKQKAILDFQATQMQHFATANAKTYFDFVFHLIFRIEKRLIEKLK